MTVLTKFIALADHLKSQFVDRDAIIDASLAAIASGQHVLLLGEPGTGKSALVNAICSSIDGASYFGWLLTKASPPEELLGPLSLRGLENDEYRRVTAAKLPEAHVAFLDEIWKANSTVLNALLSILNERTFYNGATPQKCPLVAAFGASNEYPTDTELAALYDRFLVRFWVERLDPAGLVAMLGKPEPRPLPGALTLADIETARREVAAVKLSQAGLDLMASCKSAADGAGFSASDRRWRQIARYLRAVAWYGGEAEVSDATLMALKDVLWREHKERPAVMTTIGKLASPILTEALEIADTVKAVVKESSRQAGEADVAYTTRLAKASSDVQRAVARLRALNVAGSPSAAAKVNAFIAEAQKQHKVLAREALRLSGLDTASLMGG